MTRRRVLSLAKSMGLRLRVQNFGLRLLKNADEIFLTNRPREIIPVVSLDGKRVGSGKPGPVTKQMMAAYAEYVDLYVRRNREKQIRA